MYAKLAKWDPSKRSQLENNPLLCHPACPGVPRDRSEAELGHKILSNLTPQPNLTPSATSLLRESLHWKECPGKNQTVPGASNPQSECPAYKMWVPQVSSLRPGIPLVEADRVSIQIKQIPH
jgi:hypothetical protein